MDISGIRVGVGRIEWIVVYMYQLMLQICDSHQLATQNTSLLANLFLLAVLLLLLNYHNNVLPLDILRLYIIILHRSRWIQLRGLSSRKY